MVQPTTMPQHTDAAKQPISIYRSQFTNMTATVVATPAKAHLKSKYPLGGKHAAAGLVHGLLQRTGQRLEERFRDMVRVIAVFGF